MGELRQQMIAESVFHRTDSPPLIVQVGGKLLWSGGVVGGEVVEALLHQAALQQRRVGGVQVLPSLGGSVVELLAHHDQPFQQVQEVKELLCRTETSRTPTQTASPWAEHPTNPSLRARISLELPHPAVFVPFAPATYPQKVTTDRHTPWDFSIDFGIVTTAFKQ